MARRCHSVPILTLKHGCHAFPQYDVIQLDSLGYRFVCMDYWTMPTTSLRTQEMTLDRRGNTLNLNLLFLMAELCILILLVNK